MEKQYILSEEEYNALVPKSKLEELQSIIDRTTEACVKLAFKDKRCQKGGYRRYCVHYPRTIENKGALSSNPLHCKWARMCNSKMKVYEQDWPDNGYIG